MFFPRQAKKVLMMPGSVMGETNGLYAAVTVNANPNALLVNGSGTPIMQKVQTAPRRRVGSNIRNWR